MPRRLTRPEVARRLAIRAARDAGTGLTFAALAALFHASRRTVKDAVRLSVVQWIGVLAAAPMPVAHSTPARQTAPIMASRAGHPPWQPGSRARVVLVKPDDEDEAALPEEKTDFDSDPPATAWVEGRSDVADPKENYRTRKAK